MNTLAMLGVIVLQSSTRSFLFVFSPLSISTTMRLKRKRIRIYSDETKEQIKNRNNLKFLKFSKKELKFQLKNSKFYENYNKIIVNLLLKYSFENRH